MVPEHNVATNVFFCSSKEGGVKRSEDEADKKKTTAGLKVWYKLECAWAHICCKVNNTE